MCCVVCAVVSNVVVVFCLVRVVSMLLYVFVPVCFVCCLRKCVCVFVCCRVRLLCIRLFMGRVVCFYVVDAFLLLCCAMRLCQCVVASHCCFVSSNVCTWFAL